MSYALVISSINCNAFHMYVHLKKSRHPKSEIQTLELSYASVKFIPVPLLADTYHMWNKKDTRYLGYICILKQTN